MSDLEGAALSLANGSAERRNDDNVIRRATSTSWFPNQKMRWMNNKLAGGKEYAVAVSYPSHFTEKRANREEDVVVAENSKFT